MNMDDLLDLNFGSSKPAQQTNQSAGRPAHAPVTATPIGKPANNDPFSAFVPFSDKQTKTLAQQQQERQQQQAARPPAAGTRSPDFFNSLAQNAGQPSYSSNTSTSRPAAATQIQQPRPVNPQPSSSSNGDPFSNLVSNSIPKAKPMGAMGSAASANVNTSKAAPANDWDFALFEAPKTVPAPINSNVQPSDTLDIFSSPVTSTKPASVPASSSASSKSSSFDVFDDFASFAPPTSSTNSTASPAASSSDIDFAIFDKPKPAPVPPVPAAAPAPERQPVKQTPPPQPAPVLPPRSTETAAADEAPARRPQSDKHKDRFDNEDYGLIREEPRRKQDDVRTTDREDYGPIRDEPSTRRPRPQSTTTAQSDVASNLLGSMFGALNTIKETATKTAATAVKFTAETTAQAKKFIDEKIREEEAKKVPPHLIKLLEEMGARPDDARVALQETKNDVQAAMKLLHISPPSEDHFDSSPPAQSSAERLDIDGKIAQLADMGFSVQDAQRALQRTNGDFQAALNGLTNRKQSPAAQSNTASPSMRTTSPAARPASANSTPSPRASSPAVVTKPPPQKKKLEAPPLDPQIEQQANALRLKGNELFKQGQYDDAKIIYSEALTLIPKGHPATLPLLGNRAQCSLSADSFKSCIEDCNAVLALVPDDVKSLLRRAKAYEATEKLDDSYNDYKMALELDPSQKAATQGMDRILKSKRQLEKHLENEASGNLPEHNSTSPPPVAAAVPVVQPPSGPQRSHADELADLFDPTSGSASAAAPARPGGVPLEEQGEALKYHKKLEAEKQEEEAAKAMFEEEVEQKLSMWRSRKEGNIRALLSSLDSILWPDLGWQTVTLAELVTPNQVKARYMKAINKVHPDKVQSDNLEHKMLAQGIFYTLNQSWDIFKVQNGM